MPPSTHDFKYRAAYVVNGVRLVGAQPEATFVRQIDAALGQSLGLLGEGRDRVRIGELAERLDQLATGPFPAVAGRAAARIREVLA